MSADDIAEIVSRIQAGLNGDSGLNASVKFAFPGEGVVHIDGKTVPHRVSDVDHPADCTLTMALETFKKLAKRELDPTAAFMQGKVKITGEMGVALRLQPIFQKLGGA